MKASTSAFAQSWEEAIADVKAKGGKPYAIPAGASVHKYGGLGYVGFAEEVRAQEKELGFAFDYIVVCTVTGSTHAGMLVGFAKDGRARKVIGIDASFTPAQTKAQVLEIARNTADLVELGQEIVEDDVVLIEDYAYPAYGVPSEETKEAIRLCARLEGMITDPVYEGKSMQGMIDLVNKGYFPKGSKVLYAHLGGAPAINGYATRSATDEAALILTRVRGLRPQPRPACGEVRSPRRCEASSGAIRVRGYRSLDSVHSRRERPSPRPSKSELRSSRPREERGEGEEVDAPLTAYASAARTSAISSSP